MTPSQRHACVVALILLAIPFAAPADADEIWVAPTSQQDVGGLGIGSNVVWPVTAYGLVRFVLGVPDNLQTFQGAKVVLIPHAPGGAATLNVIICAADDGQPVTGACAGPTSYPFVGTADQLLEVDVSPVVAPLVGTAGRTDLAIVAYTTPTTATDHIVGLRFVYEAKVPATVATLGANTFTGPQTAPGFAGDGSGVTNVNADRLDGLHSAAFAAATHLHNVSQISNAATLGANTFSGTQTINTGNLDLDSSTATTGVITKNGVRFLHNAGQQSTFLGEGAGSTTSYGNYNTGTGYSALSANTSGSHNSALGAHTLSVNTVASFNTAVGAYALMNTTVSGNTAVGFAALEDNTTGQYNVAIGRNAGSNATTGSYNIYLGAQVQGTAGETHTMYLGNVGWQTRAFIAGVRNATTAYANAVPVLIDSAGQLGTVSSSRRYKEDIRDMADASRRLLKLRPVTFRYAQAFADGQRPIQYGLIAEEVAEVFPDLTVLDAEGRPDTVKYQDLAVLLLNELQKQSRRVGALERQVYDLRQQLRHAGPAPGSR